jgi:hypothetical protein
MDPSGHRLRMLAEDPARFQDRLCKLTNMYYSLGFKSYHVSSLLSGRPRLLLEDIESIRQNSLHCAKRLGLLVSHKQFVAAEEAEKAKPEESKVGSGKRKGKKALYLRAKAERVKAERAAAEAARSAVTEAAAADAAETPMPAVAPATDAAAQESASWDAAVVSGELADPAGVVPAAAEGSAGAGTSLSTLPKQKPHQPGSHSGSTEEAASEAADAQAQGLPVDTSSHRLLHPTLIEFLVQRPGVLQEDPEQLLQQISSLVEAGAASSTLKALEYMLSGSKIGTLSTYTLRRKTALLKLFGYQGHAMLMCLERDEQMLMERLLWMHYCGWAYLFPRSRSHKSFKIWT